MNSRFLLSTFALAALSGAPLLSTELGTAYCFGTNCPCGNDDPTGGCINTSGVGAQLTALGSTSVSAGDLAFRASRLPTSSLSLLVISPNQRNIPFDDGRLCVGPGMARMRTHLNSVQTGVVTFDDIYTTYAAYGLVLNAGETWNAQVWYRDSSHQGVCGQRANLTNAYTVTLTP
jgi:hypothetical protein